MGAPLSIQFGTNSALIECDDAPLRHWLAHHFRHCLTPPGAKQTLLITYRVIPTAAGLLELWGNDKVLYRGPSSFHIYVYLTRDVMLKLATGNRHHLVFHAAGLAHNDRGIILCGQAGSGKSTLAAWLTAVGFDFLSDELVAVALEPLEMSGLAGPVVLKEGAAFVWRRWLSEDDVENQVHFFDGAAVFDPELLRPQAIRAAATPHVLLFPHYSPGTPLIARPLSAAAAMFHLMPRLINFAHLPNRGWADIKRLTEQTTAYSLAYSEVSLAAGWIEQACCLR
jgi:hypothetical protein